ncbi:MAG: DUF3341 domain-containing protein [Opitutales bacterium]
MPDARYVIRGVLAREEAVLGAGRELRDCGCTSAECYAPQPVDGWEDIWPQRRSPLPRFAFVGGVVGVLAGYGMQHYAMVFNYAHNAGGRPLASWPLYLPITFELMVLFAAVTAFVGLFWLLKLPRLHQPVLDSALASARANGQWLIEAKVFSRDASIAERMESVLKAHGADRVERMEVGGE